LDAIIDFINNSWVVSIFTGLAVYFITEFIKKVRDKKAYLQQVRLANKEVFNTIKLSIPEEHLPSPPILNAIHRSTAKRFNVSLDDMESLPIILDDLVKEIMDSNFLAHQSKLNYCDTLLELKTQMLHVEVEEQSHHDEKLDALKLKQSKAIISSAMSVVVAVLGSFTAFAISTLSDNRSSLFGSDFTMTMFGFFTAVLTITIGLVSLIILRDIKRNKDAETKKYD